MTPPEIAAAPVFLKVTTKAAAIMRQRLLPEQAGPGDWAEFGVSVGKSLRGLQALRPPGVHLWGFRSEEHTSELQSR